MSICIYLRVSLYVFEYVMMYIYLRIYIYIYIYIHAQTYMCVYVCGLVGGCVCWWVDVVFFTLRFDEAAYIIAFHCNSLQLTTFAVSFIRSSKTYVLTSAQCDICCMKTLSVSICFFGCLQISLLQRGVGAGC